MCMVCDGMSDAQFNAHIDRNIETYGLAYMYIEDPDPLRCFGYTVGLTLRNHPEFLVRGLSHAETGRMLNGLGFDVINNGAVYAAGHTTTWSDGRPVYFGRARGARRQALAAFARYGDAVRVLEAHLLSREPSVGTGGSQ